MCYTREEIGETTVDEILTEETPAPEVEDKETVEDEELVLVEK